MRPLPIPVSEVQRTKTASSDVLSADSSISKQKVDAPKTAQGMHPEGQTMPYACYVNSGLREQREVLSGSFSSFKSGVVSLPEW